MRRVLLIFFLIFMFNINVNATTTTYYSDYSSYGPYIDEKVESDELTDVKKTVMYRYYKEERENGEYYVKGQNNSLYPYIDEEDFITTNWSEWTDSAPNEEEGRKIKTREVYYYQEMKKVRYIHFTDIRGSNSRLNINEIIVSNNNEPISYTIYCEGCNNDFYEKITNGIITFEDSYILEDGYLRIDLNDYYHLSDLSIKFYITDFGYDEKRYTLSTSRDSSINSNIYTFVVTRLFFKNNNFNEYMERNYKLGKLIFRQPEWDEWKKSLLPIDSSSTRRVQKKLEYSYQDTMYRYYRLNKVYAANYYENAPECFPKKDEKDYKEYYQVRTRDKVVIKDEIIINNKHQKLEDFIIEDTTGKGVIDSNINYEQNGYYYASFIFPFTTIDKLVYVDIPENNRSDEKEEKQEEKDEKQEKKEEKQENKKDALEEKTKEKIEEKVEVKEEEREKKEDVNKISNNNIEKSKKEDNVKEEKQEKRITMDEISNDVEQETVIETKQPQKINNTINNENESIIINDKEIKKIENVEKKKIKKDYVISVFILTIIGLFCLYKYKKSRNK
ncbi:MAG: hypothetical protein GX190_04565 [Mollicutes bacterium]|nr:hypothetical protein [Mollicutes bacterium]